MTKRGKLVTMIRMPGAIERTVKRPKVRMIQAATEPSTGYSEIARELLGKRQFRHRHHGGKQQYQSNHPTTKVLNMTLDTRPLERMSTRSWMSSLRY